MSINDKPKFSYFFLALVSSDPKLLRKTEEKTAQEGFAIKVPVSVEQSPEKIGFGLLQSKQAGGDLTFGICFARIAFAMLDFGNYSHTVLLFKGG